MADQTGVPASPEPASPAPQDASQDPMDSLLGALDAQEEVSPRPEVSPEQAADDEAPTEEVSGESPDEELPALADGEAELEHLGKKARVPEWVKTAFEANREQATRATMEFSGLRKQTLVERQAIEAYNAFQNEAKAEFDGLSAIEAEIARYKNVNISEYDDGQLARIGFQLGQLKEQREDLARKLEAKRGDLAKRLIGHKAQMRQAAADALNARIPGGFNNTVDVELAKQAAAEGFPPEEAVELLDARVLSALWKAHQWDKLQASKQLTPRKTVAAAPVVRPGAVTTSQKEMARRAANARFQKSPSVDTLAGLINI